VACRFAVDSAHRFSAEEEIIIMIIFKILWHAFCSKLGTLFLHNRGINILMARHNVARRFEVDGMLFLCRSVNYFVCASSIIGYPSIILLLQ
jgi:hypothetical protein